MLPIKALDFNPIVQDLAVRLPETDRKTLILDMDETLVHADFGNYYSGHDHIVTFLYEDEEVTVPIFVRPGLSEFLQKVSEHFEIVVFTASKKEYADAILNLLDPDNKYFKHRFYRDNCICIQNKVFIKDLRVFVGRKLEDLILLDNSLYSFSNQLSNGVLINSFYNDKEDKELLNALSYLVNYLLQSSDVRTVNEQVFNFPAIMEQFVHKDKTKKKYREV